MRCPGLCGWIVGVFVSGALAAFPSRTLAFCQLTTSTSTPTPGTPCLTDGVPLAWVRRCTSLAVERSGTEGLEHGAVVEILRRSVAQWTNVSCDGAAVDLEMEVLDEASLCSVAQFNTEGGNVSSVAFGSFDERDLDPSAFAFTTVWHNTRTGEILDVDIELNEDRGPFGICPEPDGCASGEMVDLENVLTHEIGHTFGLAHSTDADATMFAISPSGETAKRSLEADDIAGLCAIYPPGSLPSECSFTPRGGLRLDCGGDPEGCCTVAAGTRPRSEPLWPIALPLAVAALATWCLRRRRRTRR